MFFFERLQHFLIAYAATDLLPASPVKSGFVSIDSGHFFSCRSGLVRNTRRSAPYRARGRLQGELRAHPQSACFDCRSVRLHFRNREK